MGKGGVGDSMVLGPNGTSWRLGFREIPGKGGIRESMVLEPNGTSWRIEF